ncbi:hypothetical protein FACS189476_01840 [Spirochaetia bacterium]|nr:hypothetical protein FACS189476_01840 [Spirochaetia bacterium]
MKVSKIKSTIKFAGKLAVYISLILISLVFVRKTDSTITSGDLQDFIASDKNDKIFSQQELYSSLNNFHIDGNIVTSTNNDPAILIDTSDLPDYKYVKLVVDLLGRKKTDARLYYSINGKELNEGDSVQFILRNSVNYIKLNKSSVTSMRFDPTSESGFSMSVSSIALTNRFVPRVFDFVKIAFLFLLLSAVWWKVFFGNIFIKKISSTFFLKKATLNDNQREKIAIYVLLLYMVSLLAIKIIVACGLPVFAWGAAGHDDQLLASWAGSILKLQWLGEYHNRTLIKGITFSLFLVFNYIFSVPFLTAQTLFYWSGCVFFALVFRKKYSVLSSGILFTVLFFLPITTATNTFLRIYRCNISPTLAIFLFAFFIGLYLFRNDTKRNYLFWPLGSGITLALIYNLREDAIWVMPFVIAVIIITALSMFMENKKQFTQPVIKRMILIISPIFILISANTTISAINYINYRVFVRNDLTGGNFAKMLSDIHLIKPEEDIFHTSVPKSTVNKLYKESPAFAELKPTFDIHFGGGWDGADGALDGEITDGWFMWALRDAIAGTGYFDNAPKMQDFCKRVSREIELAFDEGRLEKRSSGKFIFGNSFSESPWKHEYAYQLLPVIKRALLLVAGNKQCEIQILQADGPDKQIRMMEVITNSLVTYPETQEHITGWIISYNDKTKVEAMIFKNNSEIARLYRNGGEDVFQHFFRQGYDIENAHNSRFDSTFKLNDNLIMVITLDGIEVEHVSLDGSVRRGGGVDAGYEWTIDFLSSVDYRDIIEKTSAPRIKILNIIAGIYSRFGLALFLLGVVCYVFLTIRFVFSIGKRNLPKTLLESWLILTGIICSALVLIGGVAYTEISAFYAISSLYLSAAYPLVTGFEMLSILFCAEFLLQKGKRQSSGHLLQ